MFEILNTLFPVFLVIGLAYVLARKNFLTQHFLDVLNQLIYKVGLPALIVHSLATARRIPEDTLPVILIFFSATMIVFGLAFLFAFSLRMDRKKVGTFVQATFRGNLAYTGIPIIIYALGDVSQETTAEVITLTMFIFAPAMLLYNALAVTVLVGSRTANHTRPIQTVAGKVATNPLILASLAGILLYYLPFQLPTMAINSLALLGQMAAPTALFCVGGAMAYVSMQGRYRSAIYAAGLKVIGVPLISFALLQTVAIHPNAALVLMILSACPTAVTSYVMARELDGDDALAAGSIVLSTLACIPVLAVIIAVI